MILSDRQENGYRVFTPEDAFKSNAFRVLLQYGFSIDEAVAMLDAKQGTEEFERSLLHQQEKLMHEADLIAYRLRRLESTLGAIQSEPGLEFELVDAADQVYINSSYGRDFHVSLEHEKTISQYYNLLSITSCARIIKRDDLLDNRPTVNPDYVMTMPEHESYRLDEGARKQVKRLCLGKCIRFRRTSDPNGKRAEGNVHEPVRTPRQPRLSSEERHHPQFPLLPQSQTDSEADIETLYVPVS